MIALESNTLIQALEVFQEQTGIQASVVKKEQKDDNVIDSVITIEGTNSRFCVEIKKWSNHISVGSLIHKMQTFDERDNAILISQYINPSMAEKLKQAQVQFIDTAGNAYINHRPIYIYVRGNKLASDNLISSSVKLGSAFKSKGMKVIYEFLSHPEVADLPYREIAERTQVSLGTVGKVIDDLIAHNYMTVSKNKKQRYLDNKENLFRKWIDAYPIQIKAKQKTMLFTTDATNWWENVDITKLNGLWGGEIAAAKYTQFLNPKNAIIYINNRDISELIRKFRLRKVNSNEKPNIIIELVEPFLPLNQIDGPIAGLAHPSIVYADLVSTNDPRNHETAERLHEKYLR